MLVWSDLHEINPIATDAALTPSWVASPELQLPVGKEDLIAAANEVHQHQFHVRLKKLVTDR